MSGLGRGERRQSAAVKQMNRYKRSLMKAGTIVNAGPDYGMPKMRTQFYHNVNPIPLIPPKTARAPQGRVSGLACWPVKESDISTLAIKLAAIAAITAVVSQMLVR